MPETTAAFRGSEVDRIDYLVLEREVLVALERDGCAVSPSYHGIDWVEIDGKHPPEAHITLDSFRSLIYAFRDGSWADHLGPLPGSDQWFLDVDGDDRKELLISEIVDHHNHHNLVRCFDVRPDRLDLRWSVDRVADEGDRHRGLTWKIPRDARDVVAAPVRGGDSGGSGCA